MAMTVLIITALIIELVLLALIITNFYGKKYKETITKYLEGISVGCIAVYIFALVWLAFTM